MFAVQSVNKDGFPGFADQITGPVGLGAGVLVGFIRVIKASTKNCLDVVPADIVVNSTLAIAWETSKREKGQEVNIYNCAIGKIRKTTMRE